MACRLPISLTARILVVRSLPGLGDLLCSVPALRSLRAAYPFAKITWLGLPGTEWFQQRFPHLMDDWLAFPGFPGIPEGWQNAHATVNFFQHIHTKSYDLTLQIHGSGNYINPFLTLLGGRLQAGFYLPGQYCPHPDYFMPYPQRGSEVERLVQLMAFLGLPEQGVALEFPLKPREYEAGLHLLNTHSLVAGRYICLHPGASCGDRRWSVAEFTQVARQLAAQGWRIVLTGTAAEHNLADDIAIALHEPGMPLPVNFAGRTSLEGVAVLLQQSALLICNDTGLSHLAAALKVPSVVVFSNSDVQRWGPHDRHRHRVVDSRLAGPNTAQQVLNHAYQLLAPSAILPKAWEVCRAG